MKVIAIHDGAGAISEIVTAPDDSPTVGIVTRPGRTMTEVYVPADFQIFEDVEGNGQELADLIGQYRVIVEPENSQIGKTERQAKSS